VIDRGHSAGPSRPRRNQTGGHQQTPWKCNPFGITAGVFVADVHEPSPSLTFRLAFSRHLRRLHQFFGNSAAPFFPDQLIFMASASRRRPLSDSSYLELSPPEKQRGISAGDPGGAPLRLPSSSALSKTCQSISPFDSFAGAGSSGEGSFSSIRRILSRGPLKFCAQQFTIPRPLRRPVSPHASAAFSHPPI